MNADLQKADEQTYAIIGAAMEAHRELGFGFLEAVYQDALAVELASRQIPFRREVTLPVFYKGQKLPSSYRADFICFDEVLVEIKALGRLTGVEEAQTIKKANGRTYRGKICDSMPDVVPAIA
ncbi:MAG: GxxExxY protein [Betaproteobacteria bacterium]|nr:GxxExxY protein [Betaproteobacteria bacterium]